MGRTTVKFSGGQLAYGEFFGGTDFSGEVF